MNISKEQAYSIKGIGILLIMIHNFVDHLQGINCNEMVYSQSATDAFISNIFSSSGIWYFFAYAGWIGVPLFFFISGYGLSKKYGNRKISYKNYFKSHIVKLWKLLLPIYLFYVLISHFCFGYNYLIKGIFTVVTFTASFFADTFYEPGVYWFFGVIFQFYVLYLVFRKLSTKWLCVLIFIFLFVHYYVLFYTTEKTLIYFRYNFFGWAVPFIMGMIGARIRFTVSKHMYLLICLISLIILGQCLSLKIFAPLIEVMIIICVISFVKLRTFRIIQFIGLISSSIFVIHPFVRMIFFNTFCPTQGNSDNPLLMTIVYLVVSFLLSYMHYLLLSKTANRR